MNFRKLYPSKYLAEHDLCGRDVVVTVREVLLEKIEGPNSNGEPKGVVYFAEHPKGMILNRVNGNRIVAIYGEDTDGWIGGRVTLYPSETDFQGDTVPCIRVRKEPPMDAAPAGFPNPNAAPVQRQPVTQPTTNGRMQHQGQPTNSSAGANGQPAGVTYVDDSTNQGPAAGDTQAIPAPTHGAAAGADSQAGAQSQQ